MRRRTSPADAIQTGGVSRPIMRMAARDRVLPDENRYVIRVPNATPSLVERYAFDSKASVLAKVRFNRLIDMFFSVTAFSIGSRVDSTMPEGTQFQTDEVYLAVTGTGQEFVVPVQACGRGKHLSLDRTREMFRFCRLSFPELTPRPVGITVRQVNSAEVIAIIELVEEVGEIKVFNEKHYRLVTGGE